MAEERHITIDLARVRTPVRTALEADGLIDDLGESHVHASVDAVVLAAQSPARST